MAEDVDVAREQVTAVRRQVYAPAGVVLVGSEPALPRLASELSAGWAATLDEAVQRVPSHVPWLWLLEAGTEPRSHALGALLTEAERVGASVAGSKLLRIDAPGRLVSVGLATDVFATPYSGLEPGELDQAQHDVIRHVAFVPTSSLLIRRDLMMGLGGLDRALPPQAAALDLCQRARLLGAAVVVVPSSQVLVPVSQQQRTTQWREEAGRIRSMIKAYGPLTLLWALPVAFLVGMIESVVAPLLGRFPLFGWASAWVWNLAMLPATVAARIRARRHRTAGDAELLCYQITGSVRMRQLGTDIAERLGDLFPDRPGTGLSAIMGAGQHTLRSPAFLAGLGTFAYVVFSTRSIWAGRLPAVGYTLPLPSKASSLLEAYAGGWNVAGLGSPEPLHPSLGAFAIAQRVLFDKPGLTAAVLTVGVMWLGVVGFARLMRSWGVRSAPAYVAGVILVGGPGAAALGNTTEWTALLAVGMLPWAIRASARPFPSSLRGRLAALPRAALLTGATAALVPVLLPVPVVALLLWALIGEGRRWGAPLRAVAAAALALPLLIPWFLVVDLDTYLHDGPLRFWEPGWPLVAVVAVAAGAILVAGDRVLLAVAGWGGAVFAAGTLLARSGSYEWGREPAAAGLVLAAVGGAAIVAAAFDAPRRIHDAETVRRMATRVGLLAGVALMAGAVVTGLPGRAGLPADLYRKTFNFTAAVDAPLGSRILIAGERDLLPGDTRHLDGAAYRVVSAPVPELWEARLGDARYGDEELERTLRSIIAGEEARAGEALAPFGIRWIVLEGSTAFAGVFDGQLDMAELPGLGQPVFLSDVDAHRAVAEDGTIWQWDPPGYTGPADASGRVYFAENGDQRWGPPPWSQQGWANETASATGRVTFNPDDQLHREAMMALWWLGALLLLAAAGVGRRAR